VVGDCKLVAVRAVYRIGGAKDLVLGLQEVKMDGVLGLREAFW
jgi:hypothetical protein